MLIPIREVERWAQGLNGFIIFIYWVEHHLQLWSVCVKCVLLIAGLQPHLARVRLIGLWGWVGCLLSQRALAKETDVACG